MAGDNHDRKFVLGLLVGVGLGVVTALLLDEKRRPKLRAALVEGTKELADRIGTLARDPEKRRERRTERAGRVLRKQVDRMRSAGL